MGLGVVKAKILIVDDEYGMLRAAERVLTPNHDYDADADVEFWQPGQAASTLTMGHTAVDFWGVTGRAPNATWVHRVDAEGFYDLLVERLARYST